MQELSSKLAVGLIANRHDLKEVQREIAMDIGWNPQRLVDLDTALAHFISEEYYWKVWGHKRITFLRTMVQEIKKREGEFPALQDSLDRVLSNLPKDARKEHRFLKQYLKKRFPNDTDTEIVTKLATYATPEILQRPSISTPIHFQTLLAGKVRVEVVDSRKIVRRLIDAVLPAGHYWVYWDEMDDNGQKAPSGTYTYRVLYKGKQEETGTHIVTQVGIQ